jgi:hypothetical protein
LTGESDIYQLQHLLPISVADPFSPISTWEILPNGQNIQLEKLVPMATKGNCIVETAILGNYAKV